MEELDNKTIMCSVFFLDIVGYSKKSVTGQIALKDRFNAYLSAAIRDVPVTDRIILDTGDGAAINFIGDIEDALKAALSVRDSLLNEDPKLNHPLLVRMGINLGPVRLVRDINGQPNIVGDGINVAQRVMGFAEPGQILVSRSYFDAVSRLSPQYAELFYYQGSRTDKHVREHEVYAIGYLGDATANLTLARRSKSFLTKALDSTKTGLQPATFGMRLLHTNLIAGFERASPARRVLYAVLVLIALLAILEVVEEHLTTDTSVSSLESNKPSVTVITPGATIESVVVPKVDLPQSDGAEVASAVVAAPSQKLGTMEKRKPQSYNQAQRQAVLPKQEPDRNGLAAAEVPVAAPVIAMEDAVTSEHPVVDVKSGASSGSQTTSLAVMCKEGAEVFVDGARKGKVVESPLILPVSPGRHLVIVSHTKGMDWQIAKFEIGQTVLVSPDFCKQ
jgi:class 3 adenylate cyclase